MTGLPWGSLPVAVPMFLYWPAVAVPWPDSGFEVDFYTVWMTSEAWNGSFSASAPGYTFFRISSSNFD